MKSRLKPGNACYHSVQNLLSSSLLSKNLKIKKYKTIILPFVVYGCETLSLTLREERRLRGFGNRVLRRMIGPKKDEVTREYVMRSLLIWNPHPIILGYKIEKNEMSRACMAYVERRRVNRVLVWKREGKIPLGRPSRRWKDNIKMDLQEVEFGDTDWIEMAQDRDRWRALMNAVMNLRVP